MVSVELAHWEPFEAHWRNCLAVDTLGASERGSVAVEPAVARTEGENGGANYFSVIAVAPTLVADSAT